MTGQDDAFADGDQQYSIVTALASSTDGVYNSWNADDVPVTNTDDEVAASRSRKSGATP